MRTTNPVVKADVGSDFELDSLHIAEPGDVIAGFLRELF